MQHAAHEVLSAACCNVPQVKEDEQQAARLDAVFPCILKILPTCIFNKKDPIVLGVDVVEGIAKVSCDALHKSSLPRVAGRAESIIRCSRHIHSHQGCPLYSSLSCNNVLCSHVFYKP